MRLGGASSNCRNRRRLSAVRLARNRDARLRVAVLEEGCYGTPTIPPVARRSRQMECMLTGVAKPPIEIDSAVAL